MTESQWLASEDPAAMLRFVLASHRPSDRKLRLIAATIERAYQWVLYASTEDTSEILLAEAMADGAERIRGSHWIMSHLAEHAARESVRIHDLHRQLPLNCGILREIVGNPFRPVTVSAAWRTAEVLRLANGSYEERRFDELSILADALQDSNCDSAELLAHLQGSGPHLRGCWALDLILDNG